VQELVGLYSPQARRVVGDSDIAGVYAQQRSTLARSLLQVREIRDSRAGTSIALSVLSTDRPPSYETYLLRRRRGQWLVIHDTVLERGLVPYVQSRRLGAPGGRGEARALSAGTAASRRYRDLFLPRDRRRRGV